MPSSKASARSRAISASATRWDSDKDLLAPDNRTKQPAMSATVSLLAASSSVSSVSILRYSLHTTATALLYFEQRDLTLGMIEFAPQRTWLPQLLAVDHVGAAAVVLQTAVLCAVSVKPLVSM